MRHLIWFVLNVIDHVIEWLIVFYRRKSRMSSFEPALQYALAREGGIEEQASDPGGITKCGISLRFLKSLDTATLRKYGIKTDSENICADDVRELTTEQIKSLYKGEFWDNAPFEGINNQDIANYIFDMAIAMGISPAIKCAQRALWSTRNIRESLVDDGILGSQTLQNINSTSSVYLLAAMRSERGGEYRLIAYTHPQENMDLDGWLNRSYNQST